MPKYEVLVLVENDKTEKVFEIGDVISEKDFPKSVLEHWSKKGVLKKITAPTPKAKSEGKEE